jgi:hypothetical protein
MSIALLKRAGAQVRSLALEQETGVSALNESLKSLLQRPPQCVGRVLSQFRSLRSC